MSTMSTSIAATAERPTERPAGLRPRPIRQATTESPAVRRTLEQFLAMEAAGWKGRQGTALLCDPCEAAFMRDAVGALADQGRASIHALALDQRPVSMQIVAHAGRAAFTWKTAYDERFQDFSPGMLLLEDYTAALLADARTLASSRRWRGLWRSARMSSSQP